MKTTDDETESLIKEMYSRWENLPNPEHQPKKWAHYLKMLMLEKGMLNERRYNNS